MCETRLVARFRYDRDVIERFPAVVGGIIHATGVRNGPTPPRLVGSAAREDTTEILVTVEGHHERASGDGARALGELESLLGTHADPATIRGAVLSAQSPSFEPSRNPDPTASLLGDRSR